MTLAEASQRLAEWIAPNPAGSASQNAAVGHYGKLFRRCMGWVKRHKATGTEKVLGVIITSAPDDRISYAMLVSQGVSFYTYKVSFDLVEEKPA
jgi:hypothetical protein